MRLKFRKRMRIKSHLLLYIKHLPQLLPCIFPPHIKLQIKCIHLLSLLAQYTTLLRINHQFSLRNRITPHQQHMLLLPQSTKRPPQQRTYQRLP